MAKICVNSNYKNLIVEKCYPCQVTTGQYKNNEVSSPEITITKFQENYSILNEQLVNVSGIVEGTGRTSSHEIKLFVPIPVAGKQDTVVPNVTVLNNVVEDVRVILRDTIPPHAEIDIKTISHVDEHVKILYQFSYFTN